MTFFVLWLYFVFNFSRTLKSSYRNKLSFELNRTDDVIQRSSDCNPNDNCELISVQLVKTHDTEETEKGIVKQNVSQIAS